MITDERSGPDRLTIFYALALGVIAALYRALPYYFFDANRGLPWNLAPVGALALFVGSRWRTRYDVLLPLFSMVLADLLLIYPLAQMGYSSFTWATPVIYVCYAVYVLLGRLLRRDELSPLTLVAVALTASIQFFVLSNFAMWLTETTYPHTLAGLLECYIAAIPFYRNTILGDIFFSTLIFPAHAALLHLGVSEKARQPV